MWPNTRSLWRRKLLPVFLAIGAAALYATAQSATRRAVERSQPTAVVLGTLSVSFIAMSATRLVAPPDGARIGATTVAVLIAAGIVAPGLGRLANAAALAGAGPLGTSSVQFVVRPLIGLAGGLVLFDEKLTGSRAAGIGLMLTGVILLVRSSRQEGSSTASSTVHKGLWIAAAAGCVYAVSEILRKAAISNTDPITATWITTAAALAFVVVGFALFPKLRPDLSGLPWMWIVGAGLASAAAQALVFGALEVGDISLVSPVLAMQPLFVMGIAPLLRATGPIQVAAMWKTGILVTAGAILMAISS